MHQAAWESARRVLADHRDLLEARAVDGEPPHACVVRGWADHLASLEADQLDEREARGLAADWSDAPASLRSLVESARALCALPSLGGEGAFESRKRAQVDAFAKVVVPLSEHADRVIDVGSGHGHLTREIASRFARPVIGLERDEARVRRARELGGDAIFVVSDVLREGLPLSSGDCVIGLHACGELGDAMVVRAADTGASLALVACCLQKRRADARSSLCGDLELPKEILGLSNLAARDRGVEASRVENLAARERRLALHRLLAEAGVHLAAGAEIHGLNRRAAHHDLRSLVARAFAVRGLPPPSDAAIEAASRWAGEQWARARRFALPRTLLARVLEVFVLLDRARYLEERGFSVSIGTLFPDAVSARNLVLLATSASGHDLQSRGGDFRSALHQRNSQR